MASATNDHEQDGPDSPQATSRKETILSLMEMLLRESGNAAKGAPGLFLVYDID